MFAPVGAYSRSVVCLAMTKYSIHVFLLQVDAIASIFTHQLTEARHRGAFEMAYSGFQKLCQSLWASSCPQFHQMPSLWVSELLESLQSKSMSQLLSITRRSAGLPFYLQVGLLHDRPTMLHVSVWTLVFYRLY